MSTEEKDAPTQAQHLAQLRDTNITSSQYDLNANQPISPSAVSIIETKTEENATTPAPAAAAPATTHAYTAPTHGDSGHGSGHGSGHTSAAHSRKTSQTEIPVDEGHKVGADLSKIDAKVLTTDPRTGLSEAQHAERLAEYGLNEIVEHKPNPLLKFLGYFTGPIAYLIEAACILSAALEDWLDFAIIGALLLINAFIGFMEEARAESAVDALKSTLALRCRVMRDGKMVEMEAKFIVPGDVISLRTGDVISADAVLLPRVKKNQKWTGLHVAGGHIENMNPDETKLAEDDEDIDDAPVELSVDQSGLTGESLPTNKFPNDLLYSSSIVKTGTGLALVVKTGDKTFVGRAANLIAITTDAGHFQKVIQRIGNFLVIITVVFVVVILIVGTAAQGHSVAKTFQNALVICIASIPVGLPTVLSVTMAVGAKQLAAKQVIVKRLTAVEEMAGVDILCSDKTGTLTKNQLQLDQPYLTPNFNNVDLLRYGFLSSEHATKDAIDLCLRTAATNLVPEFKGLKADDPETPGFHTLKHDPFTSTTKMATSTVRDENTKEIYMVAKGAPQVILRLCKNDDHERATKAIIEMAKSGLRALGIARSKPFKGKLGVNDLEWELIGCVSLLDPPREDSAETIRKCAEFGISVKMVTGDTILIAKEVARRLGMDRCILSPAMLQDEHHAKVGEKKLIHMVTKADGFAQVVPEDKYRVVELLQNGEHLVGMTGDGVNDAPALKKANVGIAVHGCTDAARAAAAIVLLQPGLGTIADGVYTARAIFQRMRSYSLYRITSTIHFLIFLFSTIVAFDFTIPAILIVLITVMNDAATLVISVDNAQISRRPDKWRIGQLITLSTILAVFLVAASYVHFVLFRYVFFADDDNRDDKVATAMYLQLSSCPHFVIFSTRLPGPWYTNMPSPTFAIAVLGTQVIATFFAVYGVVSASIGWPASLAILGVSLVYFMFLDLIKLLVYRYWNYELTVYLFPFFSSRWQLLAEKKKIIEEQRNYKKRVRTMRVKVLWPVMFAEAAKKKPVQIVTKKAPDSFSTQAQTAIAH